MRLFLRNKNNNKPVIRQIIDLIPMVKNEVNKPVQEKEVGEIKIAIPSVFNIKGFRTDIEKHEIVDFVEHDEVSEEPRT